MADSIQIPQDVARPVKVTVDDKSDPLRRFLTDLLNRLVSLEGENIALKARVKTLEDAP